LLFSVCLTKRILAAWLIPSVLVQMCRSIAREMPGTCCPRSAS
jgi:hypothetical protein